MYRTLSSRLTAAWAAAALTGGLWLWACTAAQAQQGPLLSAQTLSRAVALAHEAATVLAPPGARVVVEAGSLDPRLNLAPCVRVEPYLPPGVPAWGHSRVGLRCQEGPSRWNVSLPVTVAVWARAVVVRGPLPSGTRLEPGQLQLGEIDWAAAPAAPFDDAAALAGRVLVRPLAAGQAPRAADLQARQWFAPGDVVRIVAIGPGFSVTGEGAAITPGIEGRTARVQARDGNVLTGRAIGENVIEVKL